MIVLITEDYVSFETAKLLKEKGFDDNCAALYDLRSGELNQRGVGYVFNNGQWDNFITAPTLQMVMKWLREVHKLFIHIDVIREASCWTADIQDIKNDVAIYPVKEEFSGYEQACEAAIKYCLENLI